MSINGAIGNWILLRLTDFPEELKGSNTGVYDPNGWIKARLRGADDWGLWLENPRFKITALVDDYGKSIPLDQQKEITKTALVLIRWQFIVGIIQMEPDETDQAKPVLGFVNMGQKPAVESISMDENQ